MEAANVSPSPTPPDKIFPIALGVVAIFGAAEIAGVAVFYIGKARAEYVAAHPKVVARSRRAGKTDRRSSSVEETTAAAPAAVQSTPSAAVLSTAEQLLKEATELRDRGDTTNALARLQDAAQRDPKNANVLAEMAMIYESIQLRAIERDVAQDPGNRSFGRSALRAGGHEIEEWRPAAPATTATGPGLAGVSPLDAGTTRNDADGIPDGSTFGITEVTATDSPDADSETNMKLKIAVKARPNTPIDHTKVKIQVFFYDTLDNKEVVLTDADVSYEWLTPHHDWKETNPEILAVTYLRAKNKPISPDAALSAAAAAVTPGGKKKSSTKKEPSADLPGEGGDRKYLGYIVRIYYNDQLQAVRADPTKLLNLFPPPFTAPQ